MPLVSTTCISKSSAQQSLTSAQFGGFSDQAFWWISTPPPPFPDFRIFVRRFVVCFSVQIFPEHKYIHLPGFFNLPPVSMTPEAHLELRISSRISEINQNGPDGILWGLGETDSRKDLRPKILRHCSFKFIANLIAAQNLVFFNYFCSIFLPICWCSLISVFYTRCSARDWE
jgi:hypothetical protein